ncbi:hypothetical protein [Paenibacillus sp. HJGM_3]|uniref:hypothetical protein n=1 Tax=Paenibacillus sp. HJGM_3 TaxID=3379816 RepID=UPI0038585B1E
MTTTADAIDQIAKAAQFFASVPPASAPPSPSTGTAKQSAPPTSPGSGSSDSDGLINFVVIEPDNMSSGLKEELASVKQDLLNLAGIGTAYVKSLAASKKDDSIEYSPDVWSDVFNHLPLMGASKFESQTYSNKVKGVEVATELLKLILDSISPSETTLKDFAQFIASQGKSLKFEHHNDADGFQFGAIVILIETVISGNTQTLVPKLKGYFMTYDSKDNSWVSACVSYSEVDIDFSYQKAAAVFNYGALSDSDVRQQFDQFVKNSQIDDIKKSQGFFSGTADPKKG